MKKEKIILGLAFVLLVFTSCKKDDVDVEDEVSYDIIEQQDFSPEEFEEFLLGQASNAEDEDVIQLREFFDEQNAKLMEKQDEEIAKFEELYGEQDEAPDNAFSYAFTIYRYNYKSTDVEGKSITLSSTLALGYWYFFGKRYLDPDNIVLDCHWTKGSDKEVTSIDYWKEGQDWKQALIGAYPAAPALSLAWRDMLVVMPDYLGYGASKDKVHPYLNERIAAINNYDAVVAAQKIIKDEYNSTVEDDSYMAITGYSQGGAVALATAMYFAEKNDETIQKWDVKKVVCGSGPYNPVLTMQEYMKNDDNEYPAVMPMTLLSMFSSYPEIMGRNGHTIEDYFCDTINKSDLIKRINSKAYTVDNNNEYMATILTGSKKMPVKCSSFLSDSALNPNSEIYKNLMECLEKNNLSNKSTWKKLPTADVKFYYTMADKVVPVDNTLSIIKRFNSEGKKYAQKSVTNESHHGYGSEFYKALLLDEIDDWCDSED